MYKITILLLSVAWSSAYTPCIQRSYRDFRTDDNDCRTFHICSFGRLVTLRCPSGGVFDQHSLSCVPAHSFMDRCSGRLTTSHHQHCPIGFKGRVPHPTRCAQYYHCGQERRHSGTVFGHQRGWEEGQRECPYPYVFSSKDSKCVVLESGVCGQREVPLDQCDYQVNQCEGHADCVPCHVRFPSCRGRQDGLNVWAGRQGSPYYVTCKQQRVLSTGMCKQDGAVAIFDEDTLKCVVKKEGEEKVESGKMPNLLPAIQQNVPQRIPQGILQETPQIIPQQGFVPHPVTQRVPSYLGNLPLRGSSQQHAPGHVPQVHVPNQNQQPLVPNQYPPIQNQYLQQQQQQQQKQEEIIHVPDLII